MASGHPRKDLIVLFEPTRPHPMAERRRPGSYSWPGSNYRAGQVAEPRTTCAHRRRVVSVTRSSVHRRLTGSRDTPKSCQSSPAIPVNLRCISTAEAASAQKPPLDGWPVQSTNLITSAAISLTGRASGARPLIATIAYQAAHAMRTLTTPKALTLIDKLTLIAARNHSPPCRSTAKSSGVISPRRSR